MCSVPAKTPHSDPVQTTRLVPLLGSSEKLRSRTERSASSPSWAYCTAKERLRARGKRIAFKDVPFIHFKIAFICRSLQVNSNRQTAVGISSTGGICRTTQAGSVVRRKDHRTVQDRKDDIHVVVLRNRQIGDDYLGFQIPVQDLRGTGKIGTG